MSVVATRVRPRLIEVVWLTLVWVLLWGTFSPLSILGGVVVAVAVIGAFRFPAAESHLPVRPLRLLALVGYLAYDMVVSGVEVSWLKLTPLSAGAMKKAFIALDARRSAVGIAFIPPEIFCSAVARARGFSVSWAPERSAASSR